ncbi:MAG: hypothetical protein AAF694_09770 [Bacteroidota bacterium]
MDGSRPQFNSEIFGNFTIARNRVVVLFLSFLLASTFWFLINLNKTYQANLNFPVRIAGIPDTIDIHPEVFPKVELSVEGLGGNLMTYMMNWNRDTLQTRFNSESERGYILTKGLVNSWQRSLKGVQLVSVVYPDSLNFVIDYQAEKYVPLVSQININLANSYFLEATPNLYPDSVKVIGPQRILDTLTSWRTESYTTPELTSEKVIEVSVEDTFSLVQVYPKYGYLPVKPRLYTQTELEIPLEVVDLPENVEVKLQYQRLKLTCLVPLDIYETIQSSTYVSVVRFNDIDLRIPYILPDFSFLPESVKLLFSTPSQVSYVMVQK